MKLYALIAMIALSGVMLAAAGCSKKSPEGPKVLYYANPMDPTIHSDKPMKDPMGMDYIPVYEEKAQNAAQDDAGVAGHADISISPEKQQLIGVQKEKVLYRDLAKTVKAYGTISHDQALYDLVQEYRNAASSYAGLKNSGAGEEALVTAKSILQSAEYKLGLQGFRGAQIQELLADPSALLMTGGSSRALVYAEVYERDSGLMKPGLEAVMSSPLAGAAPFSGRVIAVDPAISAETRTLKVRIMARIVPPGVRHESYVNVAIKIPAGRVLSVSDDAIVDTGERTLVFAVKDEGTFEPRAVRTGRTFDGFIEILSGVAENETVVTGANFLIDSESQLRAAMKGMKQ